jgi:hypothetical protein
MHRNQRTRLTFCLFVSLFARLAGAQANTARTDQGTTVSGVVRDSIAHTTLANAMVQLVARNDPSGFTRTAVSDSLGRFLLTDVPLGAYNLGFFHPLLDSLGVEAPLRDVYVDAYKPVIADLAVPSPARLRSAICGPQAARDSGAVIVGFVRDAQNGSPVAGVTVAGEWLEFALSRTGLARQVGRRSATTAETGWFALCDVPNGGSVALVASKGADSTGLIEVQIPPEGFVRRELSLGPAQTEVVSAVAQSAVAVAPTTRRIHVGNNRLSGTVVSVAENRPLAGAAVTIIDGPQTRTNEKGEWTISNAPGGARMIEVRAIGYYPLQRHVNVMTGGAPVQLALSTLKAVLDTVKIRASRLANVDDGGFERRRRMGNGRFITVEDVLRFSPIVTSDMFRRVPGVQFGLDPMGQKFIQVRGVFEPWCSPAIFIDDHNMSSLTVDDIDDYVPPQNIAGIEVYPESTAPPQFQTGLRGCGSIVIWTK